MPRPRDVDLAHAPKADVLCSADISGETAFLVRLQEDGGVHTTYHLKRYSELRTLDGNLRQVVSKRTWDEEGTIAHVPEFPTNGTFGFRRTMSKMGMGGFSQGQAEAMSRYLAELLGQIRTLAAVHELQQFFKEVAPEDVARLPEVFQDRYRKDQQMLKETLFALRRRVTLQTIKGYWGVDGSDKIWLIEPDGRATLDGNHHGIDYDLTESGAGSERVVDRLDGWRIDIEKSSENRLLWVNPSQPHQQHLIWVREDDAVAQAQIEKLSKVRARLGKLGALRRSGA